MPFWLRGSVGAVLLAFAAAAFATPARSQDTPPAGAELPPLPPISLIKIPKLPDYVCTEAERAALIAELEGLRERIDADEKRARDYYADLRAQAAKAREDKDAKAFAEVLARIRDFEHGDPNATSGDGALYDMTVAKARDLEAAVAASRRLPVRNCGSIDELERNRPQLDALPEFQLPPILCTEQERQALLERWKQMRDKGPEQLKIILDYLGHIHRRVRAMKGIDPQTEETVLLLDNLKTESDWAGNRMADNMLLATRMESAKKALEEMPVSDCADPRPAVQVPSVAPAGPVPPRPPLPPEPGPVPTGPICTEKERVERIEAIDVLIRAADTRILVAQSHLLMLGTLSQTLTRGRADFYDISSVNREAEQYQHIVKALHAASNLLRARRRELLARPLDPCVPPPEPAGVVPGTPAQPGEPRPPARGNKKACPPKKNQALRKPISVGSNGRVGSGARAKKKAISTLGGLAGGLLGGGGGSGGGGGGGPQVSKCRIKDSEKTVFADPATGISLRVGAKRSGNAVVVFADVAKSPDKGTFQGGWIEKPDGEVMAPAKADICAMWGEWSLTVSWTRKTYVDGNLVKTEKGGWMEGGRFNLPGMVSTDANPAGLWQQLGFSNASHGAQEVALSYPMPRGDGAPMRLLLHVTRPSQKIVDTVPFELAMTEGRDGGFSFAQVPADEPCEPDEATEALTDQIRGEGASLPPAPPPP